jgi:hypothetical protein
MTSMGRRDLLLLLIGLSDPSGQSGLGGITRIQKLLYLLEAEGSVRPSGDGFQFEAYKAGPYSPKIYDDLEFLENLDYLRRSPTPSVAREEDSDPDPTFEQFEVGSSDIEATDAEKSEVDLTFVELMGPEDVMAPGADEVSPTPDSYQEYRYYLTDLGKKKLQELMNNPVNRPFVEGIRKVRSKFARYSLSDLLYYVYTRHPNMTTESEIKEKVLRRRPMY